MTAIPGPTGTTRPPRSALETEHLVRRAQKGDEKAFEALYKRTSGRVYALCLRMSGDAEAAAELTQDVYVRCWQKLALFRGKSRFTTWLHRLTVNLVIQERKKQARIAERERSVDDLEQFAHHVHETMPETRLDLERAIANLPAGAREVLVLRDIQGYKYREVAEMKGIALGTVKAQVHRARRLLRTALER